MRQAELALRKELALARLHVARAEWALARSQGPDPLAAASAVIDLASSALARPGLGRWGRRARVALAVARALLGLGRLF